MITLKDSVEIKTTPHACMVLNLKGGGPAGIRTQGLRLRGPTRFLARDCIQATPRAHEHIQLNGPKYNSLINFAASRFVTSTQDFKENITRNR